MAEDIKKQVIAWFNSPQDYDQGIELLKRVSKKSRVLGKLIKRGETKSTLEIMIWELNKVAGLKKIPVPRAKVERNMIRKVPAAPAKEKKEKAPKKEKGEEKTRFSLIGRRDINSFSTPIQRIVRENSSLYMLRGKKHKALTNLPDDNDQETIDQRVALIDEINKISARLEVLFMAWKAFEDSGTEPDEAVLWPAAAQSSEQGAQGKKEATPRTIDELKNFKKNIQSSITKDRNQLIYCSKTKPKDGKENPMPAGPKRTKLEKRIAKKDVEIKNLDQQIAELG